MIKIQDLLPKSKMLDVYDIEGKQRAAGLRFEYSSPQTQEYEAPKINFNIFNFDLSLMRNRTRRITRRLNNVVNKRHLMEVERNGKRMYVQYDPDMPSQTEINKYKMTNFDTYEYYMPGDKVINDFTEMRPATAADLKAVDSNLGYAIDKNNRLFTFGANEQAFIGESGQTIVKPKNFVYEYYDKQSGKTIFGPSPNDIGSSFEFNQSIRYMTQDLRDIKRVNVIRSIVRETVDAFTDPVFIGLQALRYNAKVIKTANIAKERLYQYEGLVYNSRKNLPPNRQLIENRAMNTLLDVEDVWEDIHRVYKDKEALNTALKQYPFRMFDPNIDYTRHLSQPFIRKVVEPIYEDMAKSGVNDFYLKSVIPEFNLSPKAIQRYFKNIVDDKLRFFDKNIYQRAAELKFNLPNPLTALNKVIHQPIDSLGTVIRKTPLINVYPNYYSAIKAFDDLKYSYLDYLMPQYAGVNKSTQTLTSYIYNLIGKPNMVRTTSTFPMRATLTQFAIDMSMDMVLENYLAGFWELAIVNSDEARYIYYQLKSKMYESLLMNLAINFIPGSSILNQEGEYDRF